MQASDYAQKHDAERWAEQPRVGVCPLDTASPASLLTDEADQHLVDVTSILTGFVRKVHMHVF
jgi:hypothetical protein